MAREHHDGIPAGQAEILEQLRAMVSGMSAAEAQGTLRRLLAAAPLGTDPFARTPPPSSRRPRRDDAVTFRVRIDLRGTKPPLWRRLELASDLFLDEVHEIIQAAFGWTDSHLHQFGSGPDYYSPETEYYLCPYQAEEGETGIPEGEVRLDEVLAEVSGKLFYAYDFGDDWQHVIRLEAILPRDESAPRAVCTAGRRPGPAEDCGGVSGYELIAAATDPDHPDHAAAVAEFGRFYGREVSPGAFAVTPFDIDDINRALGEFGTGSRGAGTSGDAPGAGSGAGTAGSGPDSLPEPLSELLGALQTARARRQLRRLISDARLNEPALIDAETATRMVRPYTWLLDRVGADGIQLTAAGYLPPAHVAAAVAELGLDEEWIGKGNRENQTLPVLNLRESSQKMGLLRKYRGKLLLTSHARTLRADPVRLWWHLAERMPVKSPDRCEAQAGMLLLIGVAAKTTDGLYAAIAGFLGEIGWMGGGGTPLTASMAFQAAWDTDAALRRLGSFADDRRSHASPAPTAQGVAFARAALRTWPGDLHN